MAKGIDEYVVITNMLTTQIENAKREIGALNDKADDLIKQNKILNQKVTHAEKDAQQIKSIMTQNITQSNEKMQDYLKEINEYVRIIKEQKAEIKELKETK